MARRKELGSLAHGIVGSFVSRNNDVEGYWGVGKLYAFAQSVPVAELRIDLLTQEMVPPSESLAVVARTYGQKLVSMLTAYGGCITWVEKAQIVMTFGVGEVFGLTRRREVFRCCCVIVDDRGQRYEAMEEGYCRSHDPEKEVRRSR